jgi:two-component system nitrogen regulation response regulator GlnG
MERLVHFGFPGNVRQLENLCHWLTVMAPAQSIDLKDLPPELLSDAPAQQESGVASPSLGSAVAPQLPMAPLSRPADAWLADLAREARRLLDAGVPEVWDQLTRQFEGQLIHVALENTRGRRIEAAQKLGIGRNTITRKIQELGLDE